MEENVNIPNADAITRSRLLLEDYFKQLPRIIQAFIDRLNREQHGRWMALPWSAGGTVTVLSLVGAPSRFVRYEDIERDIALCLDSFMWGHNERKRN